MDRDDAALFRAAMAASQFLDLDHEDFLIHSRILLDRMANLASYLIDDAQLPPLSFATQRDWFIDSRNIPYPKDEKYAAYIRDKTVWFEELLREYRNQFIVHDQRYARFGMVFNPGSSPRIIAKAPATSPGEWSQLWQGLLAIRQRYLHSISGLEDVLLNAYELLDFFDAHAGDLSAADLKAIHRIRASHGAKLPDPAILADHLQSFLLFFRDHFLAESAMTW